ncbi:13564_t:CDS:2 [Ambispora leptoticha]|uniref:13564_t:CDS:1 n=1 Tax=Ambispora leptoticha TaxID=144679 RepID=A0A9N8V9I7_9GLOM|nr:13564_t:CDS:2 [Ambispora leptoticha]
MIQQPPNNMAILHSQQQPTHQQAVGHAQMHQQQQQHSQQVSVQQQQQQVQSVNAQQQQQQPPQQQPPQPPPTLQHLQVQQQQQSPFPQQPQQISAAASQNEQRNGTSTSKIGLLNAYIYDFLKKQGHIETPVPVQAPDGFLYEWWTVFWDVYSAKLGRPGNHTIEAQRYVEQQNRTKQNRMRILAEGLNQNGTFPYQQMGVVVNQQQPNVVGHQQTHPNQFVSRQPVVNGMMNIDSPTASSDTMVMLTNPQRMNLIKNNQMRQVPQIQQQQVPQRFMPQTKQFHSGQTIPHGQSPTLVIRNDQTTAAINGIQLHSWKPIRDEETGRCSE